MRYYRFSFRAPAPLHDEGSLSCVVQDSSVESALATARSAVASFYHVASESLRCLETAEDGVSYLDFLIPHRAYANVWV